jgi:hypothetical protein
LGANASSINYSISGVPNWLTPSSTTGTTSTSGTDVTFTVNAIANSLAPGTYGPTTITFTNSDTGQGTQARMATLTVTSLLSAVLPQSRSVQVNGTATAFATLINTGVNTASGCSIAPATSLPLTFNYQTTNPSTNAVTGSPNTPVNVAAGASQSFVIALTPTAVIASDELGFNFQCTNAAPAPIIAGVNTLLLSASTTPTPDIIALAATIQNDGIVHVTGSPSQGVFAIATFNLGPSDSITVSANTGAIVLPVAITICQTNPTSGQCLQTPGPTVSTTIGTNATPTFGIFVAASGTVPFDPAHNRIFVQFTDSSRSIRGATSVAVETQ